MSSERSVSPEAMRRSRSPSNIVAGNEKERNGRQPNSSGQKRRRDSSQ